MWAYSKGGGNLKIFLVVSQIPVQIFPLINCFSDATLTSDRIFFKDRQIFVT